MISPCRANSGLSNLCKFISLCLNENPGEGLHQTPLRPTLALRWGYELGCNKRSQEIEALCTTLEAAEVKRRSLAEVSKVLRSLTLKFPGWLKTRMTRRYLRVVSLSLLFFRRPTTVGATWKSGNELKSSCRCALELCKKRGKIVHVSWSNADKHGYPLFVLHTKIQEVFFAYLRWNSREKEKQFTERRSKRFLAN